MNFCKISILLTTKNIIHGILIAITINGEKIMGIKAITSAALVNSALNRQNKLSEKNIKPSQNTNSFEFPRYNASNISFGMARLDMEKIKKVSELENKYLKPNGLGDTEGYNKFQIYYRTIVSELMAVEPKLVEKLFTTKNGEKQKLIAHSVYGSDNNKQKFMCDSVLKLENGQELLKRIYLTEDSQGNVPAHYFSDTENFKVMIKVLDKDTLKKVLLADNTAEKDIPGSNKAVKDGVRAIIMEQFADDKKVLKDIVFHTNLKQNYPVLQGKEDLEMFLKLFADDKESIRKYFIKNVKTENENKNKNTIKNLFKKKNKEQTNNNKEYLTDFFKTVNRKQVLLDAMHNSFMETDPKLLKDIYTLSNEEGFMLNYDRASAFAENMLQLITDSDLSPEDSLEVLSKNRDFLSRHTEISLDLVEKYLNEQIAQKNK